MKTKDSLIDKRGKNENKMKKTMKNKQGKSNHYQLIE